MKIVIFSAVPLKIVDFVAFVSFNHNNNNNKNSHQDVSIVEKE